MRHTHRFPDVVVHQSTDLTRSQIVEVDSFHATTPVRTVIDLAAGRKPPLIGRLVHHLVVTNQARIDEFVKAVGELARRGKPGMLTMHKVLETRAGEAFMGESEFDGRRWHSTLDAFEEDRLRDNHAQLAGWRVLRVTYRMLMEQPEMVRNMIQRAFAAAS